MLVPGAAQRERSEAVRRRTGTVTNAIFETIPGLQRITSCCAAPGKNTEAPCPSP
jgi:hypothetical protein